MTRTITAVYSSDGKAVNAYDELVSEGYPREKLYFDKRANEIKVLVPEASRPEVEEILNRHELDKVWSTPYEPQ
ncbi:MAG: hypothetical protein ACTH3D_12835 [Halomonas sp.]|uniref:hypothetical protein n=1 Tax=Halomonas sp. TaxID=1486246 RepID=UPI003F905616